MFTEYCVRPEEGGAPETMLAGSSSTCEMTTEQDRFLVVLTVEVRSLSCALR